MYNYYIRFDKNGKFSGFNIQMLRQEPRMIDEEYTENVITTIQKPLNEDNLESPLVDTEITVQETRTRKTQAKDENGNLLFDIIEETPLPENAFLITSEQHEEYLTALNSQIKDVVLINNQIKIVDKFTDEELAAQRLEQEKQVLISQAQKLLDDNDYRQTKAALELYSAEKKQAVLDYMEALREVIRHARNGVLTDLPTATF